MDKFIVALVKRSRLVEDMFRSFPKLQRNSEKEGGGGELLTDIYSLYIYYALTIFLKDSCDAIGFISERIIIILVYP